MFEELNQKLGLKEGFSIWLGPRISKKHYEINRETGAHFDLVNENLTQLSDVIDLKKSTVMDSKLCTVDQNQDFYSYRKEGPKSGRIWSGVGLAFGVSLLKKQKAARK